MLSDEGLKKKPFLAGHVIGCKGVGMVWPLVWRSHSGTWGQPPKRGSEMLWTEWRKHLSSLTLPVSCGINPESPNNWDLSISLLSKYAVRVLSVRNAFDYTYISKSPEAKRQAIQGWCDGSLMSLKPWRLHFCPVIIHLLIYCLMFARWML